MGSRYVRCTVWSIYSPDEFSHFGGCRWEMRNEAGLLIGSPVYETRQRARAMAERFAKNHNFTIKGEITFDDRTNVEFLG